MRRSRRRPTGTITRRPACASSTPSRPSTRRATSAGCRTPSRRPLDEPPGWSPGWFGDLMPRMERIYRFAESGSTRYAVERDGAVYALDTQISHIGDILGRSPGAAGTAGRIGNVGGAIEGGIASLSLLPPVSPTKIVCVGLNYKD